MRQNLKLVLFALLAVVGLSAFECSSKEMTSAKLYLQQKNYDKAIEALKDEIAKNPKSDEGYYFLGFLYGEKGDFTKMLDNYSKSIAISKRFEKNISDSRKSYWGQSFNKGVALFNKAAKAQNPDSAKILFDKTIQSFNDAIACEPDSSDTYKNLSYALLNAGRQEEAVPSLEKLVSLKKSLDAYKLLGQIYLSRANTAKSEYKKSKVVADSVKAYELYDKTITLLEEGRKRYSQDSDVLIYLSNAYIEANKTQIALGVFKAGVDKEPGNKSYRYNYGVILLQGNDFVGAEEQFKKAVEIDPAYHNALYNMGITYVKWGTVIREDAEKAGKDDPQYKEKYRLSLPYLTKVLELKPEDPATWELLGKVYAVLGMSKESTEAFKSADKYRSK